ncbi:polyketide synthase [Aspergillus coremiiformis]|uniref:Polyketide synthase n=1 Tax=Aspergillus coremiiformis TaxID=138285 RepID=A0A5N6Z2U1_9EURO|nr:polyketide synthase [Aspergillus coremiiformis]
MSISSGREPIAIVGIGCRLPGGITSATKFWDVLCQGLDVITDVPDDRFDATTFHDSDTRKYGAVRNRKGGFVPDIHSFDAEFFGYYPAEASRIDPQQRLVLEASVHALEDSGTALEQVAGSRTGVFIGTFAYDHLAIQLTPEQRDNISPHVAMGVSVCSVANRVSHRLNLHGPSVTLDTACSSSLIAVHLACQSIWAGEGDSALAGGVNAILRPESTILLSQAGFLSPGGSCKSFDAAADGYVRSEGVGVVYLKPLSRALQDRDRVYSIICGSLVNQDGYTPEGFTVPSLKAQTALIKSVYTQAGVDPAHVRYVEAHGPGTPIGDPIEAKALGNQIGQKRSADDKSCLYIGSVKGNLGHLEGAAGVAGLIKAALTVFHRQVPPQVNHKHPNPAIDFKSLRLHVPSKLICMAEQRRKNKIFVGVNSFGAGGSNAHTILGEAPSSSHLSSSSSSRPDSPKHRVFLLSARSQPALQCAAQDLAAHLRQQQSVDLEDVAYTLNMRRSCYSQVAVLPATDVEGLCSRLDQVGSGEVSKDILTLQRNPETPHPKIAFLFSGQGGQWLGMGMALASQQPVFRESLAAFDALYSPLAGLSILDEMSPSGKSDTSRLNSTTIVQPAIAAVQIALAEMLISYGVKPAAIVGHSIGEIAAAYVAGALSREQAVYTIYLRSKIQTDVATINGLKLTTLAGNTEALKVVADDLRHRGTFAQFVKVEVPYHSRSMDLYKTEMIESLSMIQGSETLPHVDLYSTVTTCIEPGTHLTGQYWFDNVRRPVRYVETATRMLEDGCNFLIEIGPHPVLVSGTRGVAESMGIQAHVLPTMVRGSDIEPLSRLIGVAYAIGIPAEISSFNGGGGQLIDLPLYPFQREHLWFEHPEAQDRRLAKSRHPFYLDSKSLTDDGRASLRLRLSTGASPFLADHVVDGAVVFPMTGHVEAAYMAAKQYMPGMRVWLENLRFESPVVLVPAQDFAPQDFVIASRPAASNPDSVWQICSRGRINMFDHPSSSNPEALESVKSRIQMGGIQLDVEDFYTTIERSGLRYGEAFRCIKEMWRLGGEIFACVKLPTSCITDIPRFRLHPALLDACLQALFADIHHHGDPGAVYLPFHIQEIEIFGPHGTSTAFSHIRMKYRDNQFFRCDASVYDETGRVLASSSNVAGSLEHRISFEHESPLEGSSDRVPVDYTNILFLDLDLSCDFQLLRLVQNAFPEVPIHQVSFTATKTNWNTNEWGFQLDRRTLLVIPADLGVVFSTLLRVARWIHEENGGCMAPTDSQCDPFSASLQGAVRVMINELPQSRIRNFKLLEEELQTNRLSRNDITVAIRSSGRFFEQIVEVNTEEEGKDMIKLLPARGGRYFSEPGLSGSLDDVVIRQQPSIDITADDVAIEVHATGLNFKDATSGALGGRKLGLEVAGYVTHVGANVQGIETGTRVMARNLAACIPIAYLTAYYTLVYLGRLTAGQSVLIHSAAGGVGIAAIQIAKLPRRRDSVLGMGGVEAVFDSRSLSFHDNVMNATGGRGVDLVLNSLTGNMFTQSVACLAPFGRFLEIGKTDIYRNMRLGLQQFGENCSFFAPELHRQMMEEVSGLLASGKLLPLPVTVYPITGLSKALRELSRSAAIGKIAIEMPENVHVQAEPQVRLTLRGDRTYLITGGASGLGLHLARFLVERGARHLLLDLMIKQADISNYEAVASIFCPPTEWPSIGGVIHCAAVLRDIYAHETTMDDFWAVFSPKAMGAWNVHLASQNTHLEFFVLISSISSLLGFAGQFSYVAANKFLDALASHRQACGLPGLSLNLGLLGPFAGMSRKSGETDRVFDILESQGLSFINLPTVLSTLERMIIRNAKQRLVGSVDFSMYVKAHPHVARDGLFLRLLHEQDGMNRTESKRSRRDGKEQVAEVLRSGLAKIVGVEPSRISLTEKIGKYTLDSLSLTQMRAMILREYRVAYPLMRLFQSPCIEVIAEEVHSLLGNGSTVTRESLATATGAESNAFIGGGLSALSPWFIRGKGSGARVVCFHSMGTGASLFTPFLMDPPEGLDPVAVQLPGRETRADEACVTSVLEIVQQIVEEMKTWEGPPHIFWGHSFGGIIAFEVMRALRRQGKPLPYLLVTGTIAPQLASTWQRRDVFLQVLADNYSPEYLLGVSRYVDDPDFVRSILPIMRKDAPLLLGYQFTEEDMFDVPITAFAARQDDMVYPDEIQSWASHSRDFKIIQVDGDHWFLRRNWKLLQQTLVEMAVLSRGAIHIPNNSAPNPKET